MQIEAPLNDTGNAGVFLLCQGVFLFLQVGLITDVGCPTSL